VVVVIVVVAAVAAAHYKGLYKCLVYFMYGVGLHINGGVKLLMLCSAFRMQFMTGAVH